MMSSTLLPAPEVVTHHVHLGDLLRRRLDEEQLGIGRLFQMEALSAAALAVSGETR
jgi:hypothetical protein